ncbi:hypothetical protein GCE86_08775 [Micromonospora terminaliae]|uniref:Uncharacterized protein n=1 Tax=Micromonospora terminaliae TaxID=1914461 RepID=A0AAJ2ZF31_9ACTN|nr:hypothetical protein [Micromonospora terminaliae]NES28119.1 hypothetical protein [Micromonospora terminaliae]QGL47135.1 hypothetical protein GCE86_08775 [Micromonospora terminaliae]
MNIILNGLSSLAGRAVGLVAGRIAVAFTRLAFSFDDEYERRCARGEPVAFDDVFGSAQVTEALGEWREIMRPFPTYPALRNHLHESVRSLYADYTIGGRSAPAEAHFAQLLRAATLDSGGFLTAVAQVVALSMNVALPEPAYRQFSALGILGKAADDMIDFRADLQAERPNLLAALVREHPSESDPVQLASASGARMNTVWWRRHCPATWQRYLAECSTRYATLSTCWLRLASHLLWVPALLGRSTTRDVRGRL